MATCALSWPRELTPGARELGGPCVPIGFVDCMFSAVVKQRHQLKNLFYN